MDDVRLAEYFYAEVPQKPGEAARILSLLKEAGVNLLAFSGFPSGRRAQVDFVPGDAAAFRAAARKAKVRLVGPKKVFVIAGDDQPGAVAEIVRKVADANINITATQAVAAGSGRFGALLWVAPRDVKRAAEVLGVPNVKSAA